MAKKVLVVEDNELNLKLFCDLLRAHGFVAEPVSDGRVALDRARAVQPDLIIMDIQLPYVSGLELIEAIKADLGASGMKDMGRVMAELKARHGPRLDMSKASALVKAALA